MGKFKKGDAVAQQPQPPAKEPLRIREGRYYITRDGRKVGPMRHEGWDDGEPWTADNSPRYYTDNGGRVEPKGEASDPVAEWAGEPQSTKEILDELEAWIAEQDAIEAAGKGSTAGFTVPLCAYDDEPGWYAAELGRAYADGYAAGLRAAA